ncbi:HAD family hydrolase [Phyllobacterium leguminum]|uniref:HAD superfamily hydrolase (TIGR01509 family) n=1 Tax=Phyllobacterium leguminum TaxID=314237 RepID=A0A318T7Q6_9HYPH|nr:HAD family phosphatase [Phyllobacterium leguminum]PYE90621.1 HAD superfamily hydrolase (TIGR01509 family) [Phyllobacterium leguminum]
MAAPELIIFDCDGVLVDSEIIAAQVESELLTDAGYPIAPDEISERFSGLTWPDILMLVEREAGIPLSASLIEKSDRILDERLATEVEAIEGIAKAVSALKLPKCICSNSSSKRLDLMLKRTGLYDLFAPDIFAAREVGTKKGKPAPDVFLYAAEKFGADPKKTIVLEDSVHGVHAAHAAGMRVIGFTGGGHTYPGHADRLTEAGAETVINRHKDLPAMIEAMAVWSEEV